MNILSLAVIVVMIGSLTTYVNYSYLSKTVGYVISVSFILFSSFTLLMNQKIVNIAWKLLLLSLWFWLWAFVFLGTQLIVAFQGDLSPEGLARTVGYLGIFTLTYFILGPAALLKGDTIWPFLGTVISGCSSIGILGAIGLLKIGVKPWEIPILGVPWTQSIFMGANYFAVVAFIGLISSSYGYILSKTTRSKLYWGTLSTINTIALVLTYSRAAYLALLVSATVWILTSRKIRTRWKVVFILLMILILVSIVGLMQTNQEIRFFLQVKRKLTGRELLWPAAIQSISEKPFFGWGVGNVDDVVLSTVDHWRSTHNTFLDFAIMTGIPGLITLLWVIVASIWVLLRKKYWRVEDGRFLLTLLSGLLITNQFITFTPGGAGFASFILALALGQANTLRVNSFKGSYCNAKVKA